MLNYIKNFIKDLTNSLNTQQPGFSARKLTAFVITICVIYLHIKFADITSVTTFLLYDIWFVLILLGIITAQDLIKLKNGNGSTKPQDEIKVDDQNKI
jgi:hypothetical protein